MNSRNINLQDKEKWDNIFVENMIDKIGETVENLFIPLKSDVSLTDKDKSFVLEVCELWDKYLANG